MNNKILYLVISILLTLCALQFIFNKSVETKEIIVKTDTIYKEVRFIDTMIVTEYKYITRIETDTLLISETKKPIEVDIPISVYEAKGTMYNKKDTIMYKAYMSGYKVNLDSIDISAKYPKYINNITNIAKSNKININHGPQISLGYGLFNKNFDTYIGYGFQLNF